MLFIGRLCKRKQLTAVLMMMTFQSERNIDSEEESVYFQFSNDKCNHLLISSKSTKMLAHINETLSYISLKAKTKLLSSCH